jgi:hypothetical protein
MAPCHDGGAVRSIRVPGFVPSTGGLHFDNDFPHVPVMVVPVAGIQVPIGDAANGLCGGMAFAAIDLFRAGLSPPPDTTPPSQGAPLFDYLVRRLMDSFDLPAGPGRYLLWQSLPDDDVRLGWFGAAKGLIRRTIEEEWPRVRADLDGGHLSPLGLIRAHSLNPMELGRNHQVVAYGYDLDEATQDVQLLVYDPNHANDDSVLLALNLADPASRWPMGYVPGEDPPRGFFRPPYRPPDPAAMAAVAG